MADPSNAVPSSPEPQTIKAIVERDYSDVKHIRFFEACPVRILPLVSADVVKNTVKQINEILQDLTKYGGAKEVVENTVSALSLYLANPLLPHGSKACLDRLSSFIETENEVVYKPAGIVLVNPVTQALLQLEFQVAVFDKGQLPLWKDINLAELLKFTWSNDGSALPKRDAAEVLIEMSSRLKEPIPIATSKIIASEVEGGSFGVADFEFRSLLVQLLFNVRQNPVISRSLLKSSIFSPIVKMTPSSMEEDTRRMIDRTQDIISLPLVELHYAMKIYSLPSSKTVNIMADLNCDSLGMNVLEPLSEEPILVEILYSSIESWSVHNENTVGDAFCMEIKLKNSTKCKLCFESLANLAKVKARLQLKVHSAANRKVSVVMQPSQNAKESEPSAEETITSPLTPSSQPPPLSNDDQFTDKQPATKQERLLKKAIALIETPAPAKTKIVTPAANISNIIMTPPLTEIPKKLRPLTSNRTEWVNRKEELVCPLEKILDSDIGLLKDSLVTIRNHFKRKMDKKMKRSGKHLKFRLKKKQVSELLRACLPALNLPDPIEVRPRLTSSFTGIREAIDFKMDRKEIIDAILNCS